ncbi:MAG: leucyl aminopeptidase family protein, partial [Acidobacteriota bacterium]
ALQGKKRVLVLGPASALKSAVLKKLFKAGWASVLPKMVASAEPGRLGDVVDTWTGASKPVRVTLGVLPEKVSRTLSPSRSQAMRACLGSADLSAKEPTAVIVCVDSAADQVAAAVAVARALPLYDRKSTADPTDWSFLAVSPEGRPFGANPVVQNTIDAVRWSAWLVDQPAEEMNTSQFVDAAKKRFRGRRRVKISTLVGKQLLDAGMGGHHAVGRTATDPPRLLIMKQEPKRKGKQPHVALIGKGIVYDTGGLSLKVGGSMPGMKIDMGGGAAVVGAFDVLTAENPDLHLTCLVALAENSIGPTSYRPDDILDMHSGKTVEINNTDAEGRLVLADAASYARRNLGADVLIDAATLTGAQLVATGRTHAAVVSSRAGLEQLALEAGRLSGDLVHPLIFAPELFQREFKSPVADMMNSVRDRANAQSSCAAQFIWSHVEDENPAWLHCDLAGPSSGANDRGTAFGVALFAEMVRSLDRSHLTD